MKDRKIHLNVTEDLKVVAITIAKMRRETTAKLENI